MSAQRMLAPDSPAQGMEPGLPRDYGVPPRGARDPHVLPARFGMATPRALIFCAVGAAAALLALMVATSRPVPVARLVQPAGSLAEPLAPPAVADAAAAERIAVLERRIQALEAALAAQGGPVAQSVARAEDAARIAQAAAGSAAAAAKDAAEAISAAGAQDRLVPALLNLQMVAATARPWSRELRAVLDLDAARQLPAPVVEVLTSHSLRGVPTEGELHDRFVALVPAITWRMPAEHGVLDRAQTNMRAALSGIGLVAPPPPGEADAATASIAERLRRGDLAGAVSDATALDKRAEPLLVGWMAQARARLAVEQALRETILALLSRSPPQ